MINLRTFPAWPFIVAEAVAWVALAVRLWLMFPGGQRRNIPVGVVVGAVLLNVVLGIQGGSPSTAAWLSIVVCGSMLLPTIGKSDIFRDYFAVKEKYGPHSPELTALGRSFALRIMAAAGVLLILSAVLVRGITIR